MFSKGCEYAIRAAIYIASKSEYDTKISLTEIASEIGAPIPFTAKILHKLSKGRIVESIKGPNGGFSINNQSISKVNLTQIVEAIDGKSVFEECSLGFKMCNDVKPCPVHHKYKEIRHTFKIMMETTSLAEMSIGIKSNQTYLKQTEFLPPC
ncbi:MAG: Rrf2 family transcriptional regulator [Bacteroidia bacterium]|jgi:Rrf2 family transcriptional regulator, iron-sulfur cluster assembly transcription factor|nr:Rrf2 family transcriptional regulator [Bacteroidia bacterium]